MKPRKRKPAKAVKWEREAARLATKIETTPWELFQLATIAMGMMAAFTLADVTQQEPVEAECPELSYHRPVPERHQWTEGGAFTRSYADWCALGEVENRPCL